MQYIMKHLMHQETFFYALADYPDKLEWLAERIDPYLRALCAAAAGSEAELVLVGSNYDQSMTPPPFFRRYLAPHLRRAAGELHSVGKYLLTHTDGENRRLIPIYLETQFDVADLHLSAADDQYDAGRSARGVSGTNRRLGWHSGRAPL